MDTPQISLAVSVSVSATDTDTKSVDKSADSHEKNSQNGQELTEICSKQCFDSISVNS
jgi:hypothetical protein